VGKGNSAALSNVTAAHLIPDVIFALLARLLPHSAQRRRPSGMLGHKGYWEPSIAGAGTEGGLRNHLTVAGPGVPSGSIDNTLLSLADVLPTIADLSNAEQTDHPPWSGNSFSNLLKPGGQSTESQQGRFWFTMTVSGDSKACPHASKLMTETLPQLGHDRWVVCTPVTRGALPDVG
jgi:arylsulfatase A-like enzyme